MTVHMKALTIWQPWASLIIIGAKPYEFRSWAVPAWLVGKRLGIHAGARTPKRKEIVDLLTRMRLPDEAWSTGLKPEIAIPFLEKALVHPEYLPLSHMLGTALVGASKDGADVAPEFGGFVNDSDRDEHANFAWPLTAIEEMVPPRYMKGLQGLWNWGGP